MIRIAAPLAAALAASPSAGRERGDVPEKYTWNLDDVFPSEIAWRAAREELKRRIPKLAEHRGHLGDSAGALFGALDALYGVRELLERTYVYASMRSDEDTREARPREMKPEAAAARRGLRGGHLLGPAGAAGGGATQGEGLPREGAAPRAVPAAARRRAPLEAAHPLGRRGAGGGRGGEPGRRRLRLLGPQERGPPLPDREALHRRGDPAGPGGLSALPRRRPSGRTGDRSSRPSSARSRSTSGRSGRRSTRR